MKTKILIAILLFSAGIIRAQIYSGNISDHNRIVDSLNQLTATHDTIRLRILNEMIEAENDDNLWPGYNEEMKAIAEKLLAVQSPGSDSSLTKTAKKYLSASLNNIGYHYFNQGDISNALEYYKQSLHIMEEINDEKGVAISSNNIGLIYFNQGNLSRALEYYNKSLRIKRETGDKRGMAVSYNNIGSVYNNLGDITKALEYHNLSLNINRENKDSGGMAISYNNIGLIYFNQGNIPKALEYYEMSLGIYEKRGDKTGMATLYNNIGGIYDNQKDVPNALAYYIKGLNIREGMGDKKGMASSYNNIGGTYADCGELSKALEYYSLSTDILEETGDKKGMAITLNNIGKACQNYGDTIKAHEFFCRSLAISEELNDKYWMSSTLYNLGLLYQKQNNLQEFEKYACRTYKISKELGFPARIKEAASLMKDLSIIKSKEVHDEIEKKEKLKKADFFAIEINEINSKSVLMNFAILSEKGQEDYYNSVALSYMEFNSYALWRTTSNPSVTEYVYNNAIRNKGLLLKSSTSMRNAVLTSGDTVLIDNYNKWVQIKKQIDKKYVKGEDCKKLEEQAGEIERNLVKGSRQFSDFYKLQNITWMDVRKNLEPGEAAIEFIHFKNKTELEWTDTVMYCALIVRSGFQYPEMIPLCSEKDLENIIGGGSKDLDYINGVYGKKNNTEAGLYNLIWKPLEKSLEEIKTVYISPTGLLYKVSFSALNRGEDVYLCDIYNIEMKSSTGNIAESSSADQDYEFSNASIFGGIDYNGDNTNIDTDYCLGWKYLEGTRIETEHITKLIKDQGIDVNYFSGHAATEKQFKLIAGGSGLIHIATHGFFYPDPDAAITKNEKQNIGTDIYFRGGEKGFGPGTFIKSPNPFMRTGLVLAGANDIWKIEKAGLGEDGILTAQEVSGLDMRITSLVVLSACETGLGDIRGSEGVYGLQRAFKMAGVKYIIMSLWQVPDKETVEFMELFYKKLLKEKDVRQAFNETQKEMRKKYDPYFWAAFVLVE